ncbi:MAG: hypothetical protein HYV02_05470 [Deltaproteobacteria bacterium]|nr:hypothetical protein [Deltaproteobacteria bacterium]
MDSMCLIRSLFLLSLLAPLSGCFSAKTPYEGPATDETVPLAGQNAIFPHAKGWAVPEGHGAYVRDLLQFSPTACLSCHAVEGDGGTGPACRTCHPLYPHEEGWSVPTGHGAYVQSSGPNACATKCHGKDLGGGLSGIACQSCHDLYPHPEENWGGAGLHGETARIVGLGKCSGCHTEDPPGGATGVDCTSCHVSLFSHFEAGNNWFVTHRAYTKEHDAVTTGECAVCHGETLSGGSTPTSPKLDPAPACLSCHTYPHDAAWTDITQHTHGPYLMAKPLLGEAMANECAPCHGEQFDGGTSGKSCAQASCHASFPHPDQWIEQHGNYYVAVEGASKQPTCATAACHGVTLEGNPPNVAVAEKTVFGCGDCHMKIPHQEGWQVTHGTSATLTENGVMIGVQTCDDCHALAVGGTGTAPSCDGACHQHFPFPHETAALTSNAAWTKGGDGAGHNVTVWAAATAGESGKSAAAKATCDVCHGDPATGDWSGGGSAKVSCYNTACHPSYPHAPATTSLGVTFTDGVWGDGSAGTIGHALYIAETMKQAKQSFKTAVKECTFCHATIPAEKKSWSQAPPCYSCHDPQGYYPHVAGWLDVGNEFGGEHGDAIAKGNQPIAQSQCLTACHGTDAKGGFIGAAGQCSQESCHPQYPHLSSKWNPGANTKGTYPHHALAVLDTNLTVTRSDDLFVEKAFNTTCAGCHGGIITFSQTVPDLSVDSSNLYTEKNGEDHLKRCAACHQRYPHRLYTWKNWQGQAKQNFWGPEQGDTVGHYLSLLDWEIVDLTLTPDEEVQALATVKATCGMDGSECHTDNAGPKSAFAMGTCKTICHK